MRRPGGKPTPPKAGLGAAPSGPATGNLPPRAFVSNANAPQIVDHALAAGFALVFAAVAGPSGGPSNAEYVHGTHAAATYNAEALKSKVWLSVGTPPATPSALGTFVVATPQAYSDPPSRITPSAVAGSTPRVPTVVGVGQQAYADPPSIVVPSAVSGATPRVPTVIKVGQQAYADSPSAVTPSVVSGNLPRSSAVATVWPQSYVDVPAQVFPSALAAAVAPRASTVVIAGQQGYVDAPSGVFPSVVAGQTPRVNPAIYAAPQAADLTLQAWIAKPMLGPQGPTVRSFSAGPQLADLTVPARVFPSVAGAPVVAAFGPAEYRSGTHAETLYNAEALKSQVWDAVAAPPPTPPAQLGKFVSAAPQLADLTQQARLTQPLIGTVPTTGKLGTWFNSWTEDAAQITAIVLESVSSMPPPLLGDVVWAGQQQYENVAPRVWRSVVASTTPVAIGAFVATLPQTEVRPSTSIWRSVVAGQTTPVIKSVWGAPQLYDLTQPGQVFQPAWSQPPVSYALKQISAGPQQADLTLQALVVPSAIAGPGRINPTIIAGPQQVDLTQQALIIASAFSGPGRINPTIFAGPQQADLTLQAWITPSAVAGSGRITPMVVAPPQQDPTQMAPTVFAATQLGAVIPPVVDVPSTPGRRHKPPLPGPRQQAELEHRQVQEKWDAIEAAKQPKPASAEKGAPPKAEKTKVAVTKSGAQVSIRIEVPKSGELTDEEVAAVLARLLEDDEFS